MFSYPVLGLYLDKWYGIIEHKHHFLSEMFLPIL